jgi:DNA modification methylase
MVNTALFGQTPSIESTFSGANNATILCEDTIVACEKLPREHFSLIVSSPPYNIGKAYERQTELDTYIKWQTDVIASFVDLLEPRGSVCWQVGNYVDDGEVFPLDILFYDIFKRCGLQLRNRLIWHFDHGLHASRRLSGRYETMLWFSKTKNYKFNLDPIRVPSKYPGKRNYKGEGYGKPSGNPLGKNPSDFWQARLQEWETGILEVPNVKANHCEKTEHPCQYPVELIERMVLALTDEGDSVLDPFNGVGSAMIAALNHGRKAVGIDRDSAYCEVAKQRIQSFYDGTLKIRPLGKPVHVPSGREKVAQVPTEWLTEAAGGLF